jgi:hypothetical protein
VPLAELFRETAYGEPKLLLGVAEHKVELAGGNAASQCDFWAVLATQLGMLSLSVEAKAREAFGDHTAEEWLAAGESRRSKENREERLKFILNSLPPSATWQQVRYQLLHRCAAAVLESKRLSLSHAAFIVQAFDSPQVSFNEYSTFCNSFGIPPVRNALASTRFDGITLKGWADSPLATNEEVVACFAGE